MSYQHIRIVRDGPLATVTFNRPERANALSHAHLADIEAAALSFRDEPDVRAVVFTGAGKHFSSGADLSDPGPGEQSLLQRRRSARMGERAIRALLEMDQITVAAWRGAAMGGGACVALALDFRVGGDSAMMAFPEIDIGLNLMWKSLPLVVHQVGAARAKRAVIGGEHLDADVLESWGVLDERVADTEVLPRARELARFYAAKPPAAAQMIKRSINALAGALDWSIMHMDTDQNLFAAAMQDAAEARRSYRGGQPAHFTGN